MTAEVKLRTLAVANATMQTRFGTSPMRWYDQQVAQNKIDAGTCVRVRRISKRRIYEQAGANPLSDVLFQFDVIDADPETARAGLKDLVAFLHTVNLGSANGAVAATPVPAFVVLTRAGILPHPTAPAYVETADVKFWNLEE